MKFTPDYGLMRSRTFMFETTDFRAEWKRAWRDARLMRRASGGEPLLHVAAYMLEGRDHPMPWVGTRIPGDRRWALRRGLGVVRAMVRHPVLPKLS